MHERLRQVATQLMLRGVELLGKERGRPTGGPVPLEPPVRLDLTTLLMRGQRQNEAAEQERAFGALERPPIMPEAIGVPITGERKDVGVQGCRGPRVVPGGRPPQRREQKCGVETGIVRRS